MACCSVWRLEGCNPSSWYFQEASRLASPIDDSSTMAGKLIASVYLASDESISVNLDNDLLKQGLLSPDLTARLFAAIWTGL